MIKFQTLGCSNSFNRHTNNFGQKKKLHKKYECDKNTYRNKIRTAIFFHLDKTSKSHLVQDIIDMTQYFKDENILYEVIHDLEEELFFYEVCCFYKKKRMCSNFIDVSK